MRIGIVVNSVTGNTVTVAEKLKESLENNGHQVQIERISILGKEPVQGNNLKNMELKSIPDMSTYDLIILGAPVHAFSMSVVILEYLKKSDTLKGKKVVLFTTMSFPFTWLGGNRAINQLKAASEAKGATIIGTGIVSMSRSKYDKMLKELVEDFQKIVN